MLSTDNGKRTLTWQPALPVLTPHTQERAVQANRLPGAGGRNLTDGSNLYAGRGRHGENEEVGKMERKKRRPDHDPQGGSPTGRLLL